MVLGVATLLAFGLFLLGAVPYERAARAYLDAHRERYGLWGSREEEDAWRLSGRFPQLGPIGAQWSALLNFQDDEQLEPLRRRALRRGVFAIFAGLLAFPLAFVLETLVEFLIVRPLLAVLPPQAAGVLMGAIVAAFWGVVFVRARHERVAMRPWVALLGAAVSEVYIAMLFSR